MKIALWIIGFCLAGAIGAPALWAEEAPSGYWNGATRKLGRGIANIVTGPSELVREPSLTTEQDGNLAGLTIGVVRGIKSFVVREVAGVYEILTFLVPFPRNFRPVLQPEFVWMQGSWAP